MFIKTDDRVFCAQMSEYDSLDFLGILIFLFSLYTSNLRILDNKISTIVLEGKFWIMRVRTYHAFWR